MRNFQMTWITGTTNLKKSVVNLKSVSAKSKGESLFANSIIGQSLTSLDATTQARMRRKVDVCNMMAKENIPFSKYPLFL